MIGCPESHTAGVAGGAPVALGEQAWMITFADLISLLLTFTILLFTLSAEQQRGGHDAAVDSLPAPPSPAAEVASPAPTAPPQVRALLDLDYLALLLPETLAAEPALAEARLRRDEERLVISLPVGTLFAPESARLREPGRLSLAALARALGHLANRTAVVAGVRTRNALSAPIAPAQGQRLDDTDADASAAALSLALSRAMAVRAALRQVGTALTTASWVLAETGPDELGDGAGMMPDTPGAHLDLVVSATGGG
jgi:hypothetical protein